MPDDTLSDALLAAHDAGDIAALVRLYTEAADDAADIDATCFFLTHAFVFALESGNAAAPGLHARLVAHGRADPTLPIKEITP